MGLIVVVVASALAVIPYLIRLIWSQSDRNSKAVIHSRVHVHVHAR